MSRDIEAPVAGGGVTHVRVFACCSAERAGHRHYLAVAVLRILNEYVTRSASSTSFIEVFPCFFEGKYQGTPRKDGVHSQISELCCSVYCTTATGWQPSGT